MLGECPQTVSKVAQQRLERWKCAALAMGLSRLLDSAEADEGLAAGFLGSETGANVVVGVEGNMAFEFGSKVTVGTLGAKDAARAARGGSWLSLC